MSCTPEQGWTWQKAMMRGVQCAEPGWAFPLRRQGSGKTKKALRLESVTGVRCKLQNGPLSPDRRCQIQGFHWQMALDPACQVCPLSKALE